MARWDVERIPLAVADAFGAGAHGAVSREHSTCRGISGPIALDSRDRTSRRGAASAAPCLGEGA